jgi:hypothetical protein
MDNWQEKRILVLGTTYPSYSRRYTETVCTGGIEEGTLRMVRLYPIPHRYLEEGNRFHAFQWIKVKCKPSNDNRPESYKVKADSIELQQDIPSSKPDDRRYYLELKDKQEKDGASLGIVIPKSILGVKIEMKPTRERQEWLRKEKEIFAQPNFFEEPPKPIDYIDARFIVQWQCDDNRCSGHEMHLMQWGIHELYRKYSSRPDGKEKVIQAMLERLDQTKKDIFFFLGNYDSIRYNFGLMDSYSAPVRVQELLFQ